MYIVNNIQFISHYVRVMLYVICLMLYLLCGLFESLITFIYKCSRSKLLIQKRFLTNKTSKELASKLSILSQKCSKMLGLCKASCCA